MGMGGFSYLAIFFAVVCLLSFGLAWLLARKANRLSRRKVLLLAPLPLPAIVFALGAYVIINVSMTSKEYCGIDACGMAIAGVIVGYTASLVAYVLGMAAAELACRLARHPE